MAQAQVLEEIIDRRLVLAYARRAGDLPGGKELAKAKKQLQLRLAAQGRKEAASQSTCGGNADLDREVLWRLTWDRYLAKYRTPQRRQAWFQGPPPRVGRHAIGRQPHPLQPATKGRSQGN